MELEDEEDIQNVQNYYFDADNVTSELLNVTKTYERHCYPNQRSLCDISIKRFIYAFEARGASLTNYKKFDFQVMKSERWLKKL